MRCFTRSLLAVVFIALLVSADVIGAGPPPAKVVVDQVVSEEVAENQSVIGVLYYERVSDISTDVAGLVKEINVVEGDKVAEADILLRLDTEVLMREISLARTRIAQAELRIENARKDYQRLEEIFQQSGVSEKVYDDAVYTYQDAVKEKQVLEDNLEKLRIQERRSVIRAPFNGIILSKDTDVGGWVQQGSNLVRMGASDELYVRAPVAEDMLQFITMGEQVEIIINAFNRKVVGKIVNVDPVADVRTKNVFIKINIPDQPLVAENMSAEVYLASGPPRSYSIVRRAALVKNQGKDYIYTVKEGKAAILPVTIVAFLGERVAVSDPYVVPGMDVVVEGNERLMPDQAVTIVGE